MATVKVRVAVALPAVQVKKVFGWEPEFLNRSQAEAVFLTASEPMR
jgi:hypothetical protein